MLEVNSIKIQNFYSLYAYTKDDKLNLISYQSGIVLFNFVNNFMNIDLGFQNIGVHIHDKVMDT